MAIYERQPQNASRAQQRRAGLAGPVRDHGRPPGPGALHAVAGEGRQPQSHGFRRLGERGAPDLASGDSGSGGQRDSISASCKCPIRSARCTSWPTIKRAWTRSAAAAASTRASARASSYLDRVNVLAPKNVGNNYVGPGRFTAFSATARHCNGLHGRSLPPSPTLRKSTPACSSTISYQDEDFSKEKMRAKTARAEALVTRLSGRDKGPAYAAAVDRLVDLKLSQADEEGLDADAMVRLAEDAHLAAPSMATYGALIKALMHRASRKLAADYPEYANATRGTGRAASVGYVVALAMGRNDALGKSARDNKDVQRAIALAADPGRSFPRVAKLLGVGGPGGCRAEPGRVAGEVPGARRVGGDRAADRPGPRAYQPALAFETYWRRLAAGEANARAAARSTRQARRAAAG